MRAVCVVGGGEYILDTRNTQPLFLLCVLSFVTSQTFSTKVFLFLQNLLSFFLKIVPVFHITKFVHTRVSLKVVRSLLLHLFIVLTRPTRLVSFRIIYLLRCAVVVVSLRRTESHGVGNSRSTSRGGNNVVEDGSVPESVVSRDGVGEKRAARRAEACGEHRRVRRVRRRRPSPEYL